MSTTIATSTSALALLVCLLCVVADAAKSSDYNDALLAIGSSIDKIYGFSKLRSRIRETLSELRNLAKLFDQIKAENIEYPKLGEKLDLINKLIEISLLDKDKDFKCNNAKLPELYAKLFQLVREPASCLKARLPESAVFGSNIHEYIKYYRDEQFAVCSGKLEQNIKMKLDELIRKSLPRVRLFRKKWEKFKKLKDTQKRITEASLEFLQQEQENQFSLETLGAKFEDYYKNSILSVCEIINAQLGQAHEEFFSGSKNFVEIHPEAQAWLSVADVCKKILSKREKFKKLTFELAASKLVARSSSSTS